MVESENECKEQIKNLNLNNSELKENIENLVNILNSKRKTHNYLNVNFLF